MALYPIGSLYTHTVVCPFVMGAAQIAPTCARLTFLPLPARVFEFLVRSCVQVLLGPESTLHSVPSPPTSQPGPLHLIQLLNYSSVTFHRKARMDSLVLVLVFTITDPYTVHFTVRAPLPPSSSFSVRPTIENPQLSRLRPNTSCPASGCSRSTIRKTCEGGEGFNGTGLLHRYHGHTIDWGSATRRVTRAHTCLERELTIVLQHEKKVLTQPNIGSNGFIFLFPHRLGSI